MIIFGARPAGSAPNILTYNPMLLKLMLLTTILLVIAFAGLAITMLIKKNGRFPNTHISGSEELRNRGISCAQYNDVGCHPTEEWPGCSSCGTRGILKGN